MSIQRKDGAEVHRKIKFIYSVYGENKIFGGNATITIHHGSSTVDKLITLDCNYQTLDEAEAAIITSGVNWIDDHLD